MKHLQKTIRKKDRKLLDSFESMRCLACGRTGAVGHHVKTKGSFGPDELWNLMPLCSIHHTEIHKSLNDFANKYQNAKMWLLANGWSFDDSRKKWTHYE